MIGHGVSGQSSHAPDAYSAFCSQKKKETPTQAFLKAWFFQRNYRTDFGKETKSKVTKNPV